MVNFQIVITNQGRLGLISIQVNDSFNPFQLEFVSAQPQPDVVMGGQGVLLWNDLTEILGDHFVTGIKLKNTLTNEDSTLNVDGVFVKIGYRPNTEFVKDIIDLNDYNEILVDCKCATSAEGIFAAGDVTNVPYKQIIIAAGEGAKAALSVTEYLNRH